MTLTVSDAKTQVKASPGKASKQPEEAEAKGIEEF
jgi:hypothetical protein